MDSHRGPRRSIFAEEFPVNFVIPGKVIHVDEVRSDLDDVAQISPHCPENFSNVLDHRASLRPNIKMSRSKTVYFSSSDGVISTA